MATSSGALPEISRLMTASTESVEGWSIIWDRFRENTASRLWLYELYNFGESAHNLIMCAFPDPQSYTVRITIVGLGPSAYYKKNVIKMALCLNCYNFRTVKAINFLFSALHTAPFLYGKVHLGS